MKTIFWGLNRHDSVEALHYLAGRTDVAYAVFEDVSAEDDIFKFCREQQISFVDCRQLDEAISKKDFSPIDFGFCFCYHFLIPARHFSIPKHGTVNFHPAPLPEHRGLGGSSIAILEGHSEWGVTAHYMAEEYDAGPIIEVARFSLDDFDGTAYELTRLIQNENLALFKKTVSAIIDGQIPVGHPFGACGTCYNRKQLSQLKIVPPNADAGLVHKMIHAFWYPPFSGACVEIDGELFTLVDQKILNHTADLYSELQKKQEEL